MRCRFRPYRSRKLSFPARCTGLSKYSITRRFPVLISAVMFIPALSFPLCIFGADQ